MTAFCANQTEVIKCQSVQIESTKYKAQLWLKTSPVIVKKKS